MTGLDLTGWLERGAVLAAAAAIAAGCGGSASPMGMPMAAEAPMAGDMAPEQAPPPPEGRPDQAAQPPGEAALAVAGRRVVADGGRAQQQEWAAVREFPVPNYAGPYDGPRTDFRETVYWNPSVRTGATGQASVSFYLSDSITAFRATAEGISSAGKPGHGEALIASRLPVSLAAKLPLEVAIGDRIRLPVTITNTTSRSLRATLGATFGPAFELSGGRAQTAVRLARGKSHTRYYTLDVVGAASADAGAIALSVDSSNMTDKLSRVVRVVPKGFPREHSASGTLARTASRDVNVPDGVVPGTLAGTVTLYPSAAATVLSGAEALIREPTGCFEQASSANYPNVMVMSYLASTGTAKPAVVARARKAMESGYRRLTGYESPKKGFEWFGGDPGHEALTAYGLMQFRQMQKIYPDVDSDMVARTAKWLESRRDGSGGYARSSKALDSFGRASEEVTNAYITYALTEAGQTGLEKEIAAATRVAKTASDPYLVALATNSLLNTDRDSDAAQGALDRLAAMQSEDGHFGGANHSITRSGGKALDIETTALATMAMMKSPKGRENAIESGTRWITASRSGGGMFGSTQSTILALQTLTRAAETSRALPAGASVGVFVNDERVATVDKSHSGETGISIDIARHLRPGKNRVELRATQDLDLPFTLSVDYRSTNNVSSPDAPVAVSTKLSRSRTRVGKSVRLRATVKNITGRGLPMVIARVGIPGGLTYQPWQLDELVERGAVDFYETREREVILYFRSMAPNAKKRVDIQLLASVPGSYTAPASTAYLYYTDEHRHWVAPVRAKVLRKYRPRRKPKATTAKGSN